MVDFYVKLVTFIFAGVRSKFVLNLIRGISKIIHTKLLIHLRGPNSIRKNWITNFSNNLYLCNINNKS